MRIVSARADVTCFITLHDEQWQCKHDMICVLVEVYVCVLVEVYLCVLVEMYLRVLMEVYLRVLVEMYLGV